jgi:16S rRNA C967 or C1407 C5-methylase (RsmB/RsmF family)
LIEKALEFPRVKYISYSTCSIFKEENEEVVKYILKNYGEKVELVHLLKELKEIRGLKLG